MRCWWSQEFRHGYFHELRIQKQNWSFHSAGPVQLWEKDYLSTRGAMRRVQVLMLQLSNCECDSRNNFFVNLWNWSFIHLSSISLSRYEHEHIFFSKYLHFECKWKIYCISDRQWFWICFLTAQKSIPWYKSQQQYNVIKA